MQEKETTRTGEKGPIRTTHKCSGTARRGYLAGTCCVACEKPINSEGWTTDATGKIYHTRCWNEITEEIRRLREEYDNDR